MQMLCKIFLMSEEFQSPHGHYILKKGLLHVNYVPKRFLVETTWRCTWTLTLGKGLTNADIEEIVTSISPKPQSWRYISFSTAERSPKCNSTQEKSPCEQCAKKDSLYWKQLKPPWKSFFFIGPRVGPVCTISCLSNWNWSHNWYKLGPINVFSPQWWRYACTGLKLKWIPFHIFHRWNIFCFILSVPIYGKRSYEQN